ncbi:MAG TPA: lysophospholipid acyltransferase family protein [Phycisphaerae bacterium]|nr:lysophospholipid acyltransferase family protein [Phycisphaerae bacterium]
MGQTNPNTMRPYYRVLRYLAQMLYVVYFRGRVFGLRNVPQTGGVMLACNHQSFFDPVSSTLALYREGNYMARDTLFINPLFKLLIESLNAFPVKRGAGDVGAVKEIMRRLKGGRVVVVFPEATRTRDGSLGTINVNSMAIAKKAGAAVVPTVIDGAFEAWPRTQLLPRRGLMYVTYAETITPEQVQEWPAERIAETVTKRLKSSLEVSRRMRRQALAGSVPHGTRYDVCEPL